MYVPNPTARFGEDAAVELLKRKGYKIIERNFRKGYGEIDIVSTYKNTLVFVEVKTRTSNLFGGAIEAISDLKLKKLIKTCEFYKILHPDSPENMRIDAVLIDLIGEKISKIVHIENISG